MSKISENIRKLIQRGILKLTNVFSDRSKVMKVDDIKWKLYLSDVCLGEVVFKESEMFRLEGIITFSEHGEQLKDYFNFIISDEFKTEKTELSQSFKKYYESSEWTIIDQEGKKEGIWSPVVYPDGTIYMKYNCALPN